MRTKHLIVGTACGLALGAGVIAAVDAGTQTADAQGDFKVTPAQLQINQKISQAAVRRSNQGLNYLAPIRTSQSDAADTGRNGVTPLANVPGSGDGWTSSQIGNAAITGSKIANEAVDSEKIAPGGVTSGDLAEQLRDRTEDRQRGRRLREDRARRRHLGRPGRQRRDDVQDRRGSGHRPEDAGPAPSTPRRSPTTRSPRPSLTADVRANLPALGSEGPRRRNGAVAGARGDRCAAPRVGRFHHDVQPGRQHLRVPGDAADLRRLPGGLPGPGHDQQPGRSPARAFACAC